MKTVDRHRCRISSVPLNIAASMGIILLMEKTAQDNDPSMAAEDRPLTLFPPDEIFDYAVRESTRARTVRLHMTPEDGLVIVIPAGYSRKKLPEIIRNKQSWIENARIWAEDQRKQKAARTPPRIPGEIDLLAIGERWHVSTSRTPSDRVTTREHPDWQLLVSGNTEDLPGSLTALSRWTRRKAHAHLVPWLQGLSHETGLDFKKVMIGNQSTRWASCSPKGTISLNQKLLYLPPRLVQYVLIHELCHLEHMNHSRRFWSLVAHHEPSWRERRRELSESWQLVPSWLDC